jgi:hypothetical protein
MKLSGPLTPRLARQGPQGVKPKPPDWKPSHQTTSMPMRPTGGRPCGKPSATPRPR